MFMKASDSTSDNKQMFMKASDSTSVDNGMKIYISFIYIY